MVIKRKRPLPSVVKVGKETLLSDGFLSIEIERTNASSGRVPKVRPAKDVHRRSYFFLVHVTAKKETLYVPVSVGSGRVSTGFIYQIEGTAAGKAKASISGRGDDVSIVTMGSIVYSKIPVGKTASYRIMVEIEDLSKEEYKVVISRINYKLNTNDSRYKRLLLEIPTKSVHFK